MKRFWAIATATTFPLWSIVVVPAASRQPFLPATSQQVLSRERNILPPDIKPITLTNAQLALGEQQVKQMLRDRPELVQYVHSGDLLYTWVVRQMAGAADGDLIVWSDDFGAFPDEFNAYHRPPDANRKGMITLRRRFAVGPQTGKLIPADHQWMGFIFELFNISNYQDSMSILQKALDGKMTREQFVREGARYEFKAIARIALFYRKYWRALTIRRHLPSDALVWKTDAPATFDEWLGRFSNPLGYPNSFWGKYYDESILPYRTAMEAYEKQYGKRPVPPMNAPKTSGFLG